MNLNAQSKNRFHRAALAILPFMPRRHGSDLGIPVVLRLTVFAALITPHWASAAAGRIATGTDGGPGGPLVKAFTSRTQTNVASFFPYTPSFSGGVRVAVGDVNGDGAPDIITGSGVGGGHVKVFSGRDQSELRSFLPYDPGFLGGIYVAAGDVNGDGFDDVVTGTDEETRGHVKVFDGLTGAEVRSFFAYPAGFRGGVRVAVGDLNGDGRADIITGAGPGGGPHVKVFDGASNAEVRTFFAFDPTFSGGVFVGAGDVNGDGLDDIIVGSGVSGHVKVFDARTGSELHSFFAYDAGFSGGVRVAAGDLDGDGRAEIVTTPGPGAPPHVRVFDGRSGKETAKFLAYPETMTNGVFISVASAKAPRLEIDRLRLRERDEIQLQWPSGCLCELEGNPDVSDPKAWSVLEVRPVESGNRMGLVLPAEEKFQFFRLKCDEEAVR
jgi:hypothetical protein